MADSRRIRSYFVGNFEMGKCRNLGFCHVGVYLCDVGSGYRGGIEEMEKGI